MVRRLIDEIGILYVAFSVNVKLTAIIVYEIIADNIISVSC